MLTQQSLQTAIPRFVAQTIRDIWDLQPRLEKPRSRVVPKLIIQPKFRAGFDFLLLRELMVIHAPMAWHMVGTLSSGVYG